MTSRNNLHIALIIILLAAGCSTTTEHLESSPGTVKAEASFARNYQAVYRDLTNAARRCATGASIGLAASFELDAEIYSELGFGEAAFRLSNVGVSNFYWKAIIKKSGANSSHLTVWSGNTVNNDYWAKKVIQWAGGDQTC